MDMNLSKLCEIVKDRGVSHATVPEVTELDTTEQLTFSLSLLTDSMDMNLSKLLEIMKDQKA